MTPGSISSNDVPSSMGREECYRELESMGIECDKFNEFLEGRIVQELPIIINLLRFAGSNNPNPDPAALNLLVAALSSEAGIPTSMGTVDEINHKIESMGNEKCESMGIDKREFIDAMRTARKEINKETALSAAASDVDEVVDDAVLFSVGDSVQIMGLVGAPQYNDMRGIVVSDFDRTKNRCGVKVHGGKGPMLALQVHNLTMIRKAKQSSSVDVKFPLRVHFDDRKQSVKPDDRSTLQQENIAILHDFGAHADSVNFGALHATTKSKQASSTGWNGVIEYSYNTKQVANIMKNFRKCKKDAVKIVLSTFDAGECNSFRLGLVDNGLIPVILGFLSQCEHEDFNEMVRKVKGNLRTPVDWIEILAHLSIHEQCKLEIANGIQAVVRCLCDDTKRFFFKSNKCWHEAVPPFLGLVFILLSSSDDSSSKVTASTVCNILLQNEGFLESIVHRCFWTSYRPDLVSEYESHQLSVDVKSLETNVHKLTRNIIFIGLERNVTETDADAELNRLTVPEAFCQDGLDLITTIAKTPVVSKAYDPECKVNYVVGKIRMLKLVDSVDREDHFTTLIMLTDCFDNDAIADAIAEVIEFGSKFIAGIDDAMSILELSCSMLVRKAQGNVYPIDKRIAFAIKSDLFEMCFEFLARFECDPSVRLIACDAKRDELIEYLVEIADIIRAVALHQNTSKAIRDRQSHIMQSLTPLVPQLKSEQSVQFVEILSSIMDLNEGSCSRCNKPIEWRTALFCERCRRVAYCGVKCQKKDWRHGTHSNDCSILAHSADVLGLTTFEVKSSRNKSELTGLRNNIVTTLKKLFLRYEAVLSRQLLTFPDRSHHIVVFNLSNKQHTLGVVHYHDRFTCSKQRAWFEEFTSPDKVICLFISDVFNGEINEDGNYNKITLYAAFPLRQA